MPNSVPNAFVEVVPPANGKREDRIVFSLCIGILALAASLMLWLYPSSNTQFVAVPKPVLASLTALSNAGEELMLLRDIEGQTPELLNLAAMGIAPFSASSLKHSLKLSWAQQGDCFIGITEQSIQGQPSYLLRLRLDKQQASSEWRALDEHTPPSPTAETDIETETRAKLANWCQDDSEQWHNSATLAQDTRASH